METLKISKVNVLKGNILRRHDLNGRRLLVRNKNNYLGYMLVAILLLLWAGGQHLILRHDPMSGFLDPNIWLLLLFSLIAFIVITGVCWWLLQKFWMSLDLPDLGDMVSQFNELSPWQQLGFYWASFGLLFLAAVGVLTAIL
jgi:hypothetical protein